MAGGSEEETIVFFLQIRSLLQLRLYLDHEGMSGVVENRVFTSGQEGRREGDIVEFAGAGFGCKIYLESNSSQNFVRMQGFNENTPVLCPSGQMAPLKLETAIRAFRGSFVDIDFLLN